jgi:transcriptional regulator with XRE-family HTH domain
MGRSTRPRPVRLAAKLKQIRESLDLSQEKMVERLNYTKSPLVASQISEFENDKREPPVQVILCYARAAGILMEYLVDDELTLPEKLPGKAFEWVMKK